MKNSRITFAFICLLFIGCQKDSTNNFPLHFDMSYNFQVNQARKHFTPELSKKITFFNDGRYHRTEDTGLFPFHLFKSTWVTFRGKWSMKDNVLLLSDEEIIDCRCKCQENEPSEWIECDIDYDHIPLGLSEQFKEFELVSITEDFLLIKNPDFVPNK